MELTFTELTWLCQIIKVRKLAGFKIFEALATREAEETYGSLSEKGILENGKLSDQGLSMIDALSLYANAKRFLRLGHHGVFANYQDHEYVLIAEKDNIFSIDLITQDMITAIILARFKKLDSLQDGEYKKRFVSKKRFAQFMEEHEDAEALFYYRVDLDHKAEDKSVLFISDGYFQHYNAITGELDMYPKSLVQTGIEHIYEAEVS